MENNSWNLFIDDIRDLSFDKFSGSDWHHNKEWIIVRSYEDAIKIIKEKKSLPNAVSFDHDLGCDSSGKELPDGYDFAKALVDFDINNTYKLPSDFEYKVHSDNPVGSLNIKSYLNSYLKHIGRI